MPYKFSFMANIGRMHNYATFAKTDLSKSKKNATGFTYLYLRNLPTIIMILLQLINITHLLPLSYMQYSHWLLMKMMILLANDNISSTPRHVKHIQNKSNQKQRTLPDEF